MNNIFNFFYAVLLLASICSAQQVFANDYAQGGGGIKREGEYLTFGSSKVKLTHAEIDSIPGAEMVKRVIQKMDLPQDIRGKLFEAILPSESHRFFYVDKL